MNLPTLPLVGPHTEPGDLDALLSAISGAIDALVAWDIRAFDSAVERQHSICARLASAAELLANQRAALPHASATGSTALPDPTAFLATTRKIRELNRVYDQLLQHSIQWTRTIQSIHEAGGHSFSGTSVHFRG